MLAGGRKIFMSALGVHCNVIDFESAFQSIVRSDN
jgi:hypothetical protein